MSDARRSKRKNKLLASLLIAAFIIPYVEVAAYAVTLTLGGANDPNDSGNVATGSDYKQWDAQFRYNIAIGADANAASAELYAIAIGTGATATGSHSIALGRNSSTANYDYAISIGVSAQATYDYAVALGRSAQATAAYSVALGSYSTANESNTVSVGGTTNDVTVYRTISNMASATIASGGRYAMTTGQMYEFGEAVKSALGGTTEYITDGTSNNLSVGLSRAFNVNGLDTSFSSVQSVVNSIDAQFTSIGNTIADTVGAGMTFSETTGALSLTGNPFVGKATIVEGFNELGAQAAKAISDASTFTDGKLTANLKVGDKENLNVQQALNEVGNAAAWNLKVNENGATYSVGNGKTITLKNGSNIDITTDDNGNYTFKVADSPTFTNVTANEKITVGGTGNQTTIDGGKITATSGGTTTTITGGTIKAVSGEFSGNLSAADITASGAVSGNTGSFTTSVTVGGTNGVSINGSSLSIGNGTANLTGSSLKVGEMTYEAGSTNKLAFNTETKITGVADGKNPTDAVNFRQLTEVQNTLQGNIDTKASELDANITQAVEDYQAADTELEGKISSVESDYKAADTEIRGEISRVESEYQAADAAIRGEINSVDERLSGEISRVESAYKAADEALSARLDGHDADISNLKADNAAQNSRLDAHDADIANLNADNVRQDADISNLKADSAAQNSRLDGHDADIANLNADNVRQDADINNLKADSAAQNSRLDAHDADIANLNADNVRQDADIKNLGLDNQRQDADIKNLGLDNQRQDARLDGHDTELAAIGNVLGENYSNPTFTRATVNGSLKVGNVTMTNSRDDGANALDMGGANVTNMADGTIAAGSTDGVTGGELHNTARSITEIFNVDGEGFEVRADGTVTGGFTANGKSGLTVQEALNSLSAGGGSVSYTDITVGSVYITDGGINMGGGTITGLADGGIYQGSTDAVTGNQLWESYQRMGTLENYVYRRMDDLQESINVVGAHAAALSGLHPIQYNPYEPTTLSAAIGTYRDEYAVAVGVFHYVRENVLFNMGASLCSDGDVMGRMGISLAVGKETKRRPELARDVVGMQRQMLAMQAKLDALEEKNAKSEAERAKSEAERARLAEENRRDKEIIRQNAETLKKNEEIMKQNAELIRELTKRLEAKK